MSNFETIYQALFDRLRLATGVKTASRRLKHWNDVPAKDQPALYTAQGGEVPEQVRGVPTKWRLSVDVYLYVTVPKDTDIPATALNGLIGAIRDAMAPPEGLDRLKGVQTLGGLVSHAWISGQIEVYDGVLGNQAVAMIPIEILTA